jgi:hypothetical protein
MTDMNEDEKILFSNLADFYIDLHGMATGSLLASQFMQSVWISREFPEFWQEWTAALPYVEQYVWRMEDGDREQLLREFTEGMVERKPTEKKEDPTWSQN